MTHLRWPALLAAFLGTSVVPPAVAASPARRAAANRAPAPVHVILSGHGATIEIAGPTAVAAIGTGAGPKAEPWDLITVTVRAGELANAYVRARSGAAPEVVKGPDRAALDAGIARASRGPDTDAWHVVAGRAVFPLVDLPMWAFSAATGEAGERRLPIEIVTDVWVEGDGPYEGARQTMLTIVGPFDTLPNPAALTAPYQKVVASELDGPLRWLENAYTHDGLAWRQRLYWTPGGHFIVRYQAPEARTKEIDLFRAAAERIARAIRVDEPESATPQREPTKR